MLKFRGSQRRTTQYYYAKEFALNQHYLRIDDNIKKAWYENGLAILQIRDDGLYKEKFDTFEDYLEKRWGFSERHGYRLLNSASFMAKLTSENVNKNGEFVHKLTSENVSNFNRFVHTEVKILPQNEGQIRPLLALENDSERIHVWNKSARLA